MDLRIARVPSSALALQGDDIAWVHPENPLAVHNMVTINAIPFMLGVVPVGTKGFPHVDCIAVNGPKRRELNLQLNQVVQVTLPEN